MVINSYPNLIICTNAIIVEYRSSNVNPPEALRCDRRVIWKGPRTELNWAVTNEMSLGLGGGGVSFRQTQGHQTQNYNARLATDETHKIYGEEKKKFTYEFHIHQSIIPFWMLKKTAVINLSALQQTCCSSDNAEVIPRDYALFHSSWTTCVKTWFSSPSQIWSILLNVNNRKLQKDSQF